MQIDRWILLLIFSLKASFAFSQFQFSEPVIPPRDSTDFRLERSAITPVSYFQLLKGDFIQQAMAPVLLSSRDLYGFAGFAGATAMLVALDKPINRAAIKTQELGVVHTVSPLITKLGGRYGLFTMLAIGSYSYLAKNQYLKTTTLLATHAYLTSGVWVSVGKFLSGRERPSYYDPLTGIHNGYWHGPLFQFKNTAAGIKPDGGQYSSFPSGHAGAAFSIATVYAEMYKQSKWVPWLAYSTASLVALSRVTENRHWLSDVFVSSTLGYLCGKQAVRNFHRLERLSSLTRKKKGFISYNLNITSQALLTDIVYHFD